MAVFVHREVMQDNHGQKHNLATSDALAACRFPKGSNGLSLPALLGERAATPTSSSCPMQWGKRRGSPPAPLEAYPRRGQPPRSIPASSVALVRGAPRGSRGSRPARARQPHRPGPWPAPPSRSIESEGSRDQDPVPHAAVKAEQLPGVGGEAGAPWKGCPQGETATPPNVSHGGVAKSRRPGLGTRLAAMTI